MIVQSSLQTLPLDTMYPGKEYLVVITEGTGPVSLKFRHQGASPAVLHPNFISVEADVILMQFVCPATEMALVWDSAPSSPYRVSVFPITLAEY